MLPRNSANTAVVIPVRGWLYSPGGTIKGILWTESGTGVGGPLAAESCRWDHERPDVEALYPQIPPGSTIGFTCSFHVPFEFLPGGPGCGGGAGLGVPCPTETHLASTVKIYVVAPDGFVEEVQHLDPDCSYSSTCSYVPNLAG